MKKFLSWFKNSTKIKRWMFLILIGLVLTCFGFSKMLTSERLELKDLILIIATFVVGFISFVLGIVYIQRRNLEILIEKNEVDTNNKELKQLVSNSIYEKGPNIVVIGGGNGINNILKGLKNYTNNLTAIVPVSSYGRPATMSIKELKLHPVEDIKNSIVSLSPNTEEMKNIINYTFDEGKLKDLSFGDLYLYVMQKVYGDFTNSVQKASNILSMVGKVLPVTLDEMRICAVLQFVGLRYTLLIFVTLFDTICFILLFSSITVPSCNSAHILISSNVTGKTLPTIFKTFLLTS